MQHHLTRHAQHLKCDQCDKSFSRRDTLVSHFSAAHSGYGKPSNQCGECGKTFGRPIWNAMYVDFMMAKLTRSNVVSVVFYVCPTHNFLRDHASKCSTDTLPSGHSQFVNNLQTYWSYDDTVGTRRGELPTAEKIKACGWKYHSKVIVTSY